MRCPVCAAPTTEERMGAVHVDQCTQCKALWFDRAELVASLLHRVPGLPVHLGIPTPKAAASEQMSCPRDKDQRLLRDYEWLGVSLARCPACNGVLCSAAGWQDLLDAAAAKMQRPRQRSAARDTVELVLTVLGSGF
jgi:Zn-finger nucleic acid-binding protein